MSEKDTSKNGILPENVMKTDRYTILFREDNRGGPGGYESTYLTSEGNATKDSLYAKLDSFNGVSTAVKYRAIRNRNADELEKAIERGGRVGVVSGFKPSGAYHFGHSLAASTMAFFQKNGVQVFMPVADLEAELDTDLTRDQYVFWAADNLLDWGATGVDLDNAHVYLQTEESRVTEFAYAMAKYVDLQSCFDIYGFQKVRDEMPFVMSGLTQVGDILLPQHKDFGNYHSFMLSGQDQDGHMKMTTKLSDRHMESYKERSIVKTRPSSVYIPHVRGLFGNKQSSSRPDETIYMGSGVKKEGIDSRIDSAIKKIDRAVAVSVENVEKFALDMVTYIYQFEVHNRLDLNRAHTDERLISMCKENGQNNIDLIKNNIESVMKSHQRRREAVLRHAIARVERKPSDVDFWSIPDGSRVGEEKRNKTKWYDIVYEMRGALVP